MKTPERCKVCGNIHSGQFCPDVKMIKFYPNGAIEHVEYYPTQEKIVEAMVRTRLEAELRKIKRGKCEEGGHEKENS